MNAPAPQPRERPRRRSAPALARLVACGAVAAFAACDDPPVEGDPARAPSGAGTDAATTPDVANADLLQELRAMRASLERLAQRDPAASPATEPATAAAGHERERDRDRAADLATAMAPLRDAMQTLAAAQTEQQQRQLALTQELSRWSALLAGAVHERSRGEVTALQQRLAALEQQLVQQDQRHRDVETTVREALDRTTERLEAFLRTVETLRRDDAPVQPQPQPEPQPAAAQPASPTGRQPAPEPPSPAPGATPPDRRQADLAPAHRTQQSRTWLLAVLVGGLVAVGVLAWRLARPGPLRTAPPDLDDDAALAPADRSTEELWMAAHLLGEAVGRLRQQARGEPVPADAPHLATGPDGADVRDGDAPGDEAPAEDGAVDEATGDADLDEVFVLEDEFDLAAPDADAVIETDSRDEPPPRDAGPPRERVVELPPPGRPAVRPQHLQVVLRANDRVRARARLATFLRRDPRVLQQPEPRIVDTADGLLVDCDLLPGQLAGECEHVRSMLVRLAAAD